MQQVLYLQVDDDVAAVQNLLEGAQAKQVLLVVPKGCDTLRDGLNVRLVRRYAQDLGLAVALITRDSRTRQMAREGGLAVFSTLRRGRRGRWRLPEPRRSPAEQAVATRVAGLRSGRGDVGYGDAISLWAGRALALLLFVGLLALVVTLAALTVPQAEVTVTPYREPIAVSLELRADPEAEKSNLQSLTIPARIVEVQVEDTAEVATVSKKDAPDAPATGTVTFVNQTANPLRILPGAVVRTSTGTTVRFTTVTTATLAPTVGATASAGIEALEPGPGGNVPFATINDVETSGLRGKVRVTNEAPTKGGGVKQVGVVTRADMERLKGPLLEKLEQRAYAELQAQLGEQEFLPPESLTIEIFSEVYDQFLDAEADVLKMQMRILARGTAVDVASANLLAYDALEAQIPTTYDLNSQDITFALDDQVRMEGRSVLFKVTAAAQLVAEVDKGAVRSLVAGLPAGEAAAALTDEFALGAQPVVDVQPEWIKRWDWLDRVPFLPFRIQVLVSE